MKGKKALRIEMQKLRDQLDKRKKEELDQGICSRLLDIVDQRNVRSVHTFIPMGNEIDLHPFIAELLHRKIAVIIPKSLSNRKLQHLVLRSLKELEEGIFGTRHPSGNQEYAGTYDLIIVPGLAFDPAHNRIGYGVGYYDLFLKDHPAAWKIGVCYPFQIVDRLPIEPHDVRMDEIIY